MLSMFFHSSILSKSGASTKPGALQLTPNVMRRSPEIKAVVGGLILGLCGVRSGVGTQTKVVVEQI
jgi:hypothetical protein